MPARTDAHPADRVRARRRMAFPAQVDDVATALLDHAISFASRVVAQS